MNKYICDINLIGALLPNDASETFFCIRFLVSTMRNFSFNKDDERTNKKPEIATTASEEEKSQKTHIL